MGRRRGRIIRLPALCPDLDISGQHSEEKKRGVEGQERVGENINLCGVGVRLSGSALSA